MSAEMSRDPDAINRLIGRFTDLQERWGRELHSFDWDLLQALARDGAQAYNEGAGRSFHALALDGTQHTAFHERFLDASLEAGFDPFKLVHPGSGAAPQPVIDHASLAEEAQENSSSARMRATLMDVARARFESAVQEMENAQGDPPDWLLETASTCGESFPADLLQRISPELANGSHSVGSKHSVNPLEGYLSAAEVIVDQRQPYG
jgi:hypothetical protein